VIYGVKSEPGKEPHQWKVAPFASVGADEQFQARFIALAELFGGAMWSEDKRTSIIDKFWSMVLEGFTPAFLHLRQAIDMESTPNTPILNLRNEFDGFYSKLWTAYEHRLSDLALEMGYKINFLFAENEKQFEQQSKQFGKQFGFDDEVLKYLGQQRAAWQNKLVNIRNKVIQHARIPAEAVPVVYRSSTAKVYFDNCWRMAEWFSAILMAKHLSPSVELAELPAEISNNGRRAFVIQFKPGIKFRE
jgi:hypothetical protein